MPILPHSLAIVLLALLLGTVSGCMSPLLEAALQGDSQRVRTLLDQGEREDFEGAFYTSACSGHIEVARLFLERGANVNYVAPYGGHSPLQCAAHEGRAEMVSMLLNSGANLDYKNSHGMTALDLAKQQGRRSVVQILEEAQGSPTARPPQRPAPLPPTKESPPPIY